MALTNAPDLTKRAPRSPRIRLGGYVILPRMLDKGRALINNTVGEFHFNCPLDQQFTTFAGIDAEALKAQLAAGKGDGEILEWIQQNAKNKPAEWQIAAWSAHAELRTAGDIEMRDFFNKLQSAAGPKREDISTLFELLDLDDYTTYGGKA